MILLDSAVPTSTVSFLSATVVQVTFSEAVSGVDSSSNWQLANCTVLDVTGSDAVYNISILPVGSDVMMTIQLLATMSVIDEAGNTLGAASNVASFSFGKKTKIMLCGSGHR